MQRKMKQILSKMAIVCLAGGFSILGMLGIWGNSFAAEPVRPENNLENLEADDEPIARPENPQYIRPSIQCPSELEELLPLLLRDLPSYANRVNQRAYPLDIRTGNIPGYVLLAARPDFEPLPLTSRAYTPTQEDDTTQIFFTTLERQYVPNASVRLQHHHWAFLTQTTRGWRLVLMVSAIDNVPADEPPTPPHDSSEGVIAQAIRLWLRDCQAGSVAPI